MPTQISTRQLQKKYNVSPVDLLDAISWIMAVSIGVAGPFFDKVRFLHCTALHFVRKILTQFLLLHFNETTADGQRQVDHGV